MNDLAWYKELASFVVIAEIAVGVWALRRHRRWSLGIVVISICLKGQYLWVGRAIYAWQVIVVVDALRAFQIERPRIRSHGEFALCNGLMRGYFVYGAVVSILMWALYHFERLGGPGTEVSSARILTQCVYFGFLWCLYLFGARSSLVSSAVWLARFLVALGVATAVGALFQIFCVRKFNLNPFPIIGSDGEIRSAFIRSAEVIDEAFRATSFAGEPKHLGLLMALSFAAFFLLRLHRANSRRIVMLLAPALLLLAQMASLSTTGLVLTGSSVALLAAMAPVRLRPIDVIFGGVVALLFVNLALSAQSDLGAATRKQVAKTGLEVQDESIARALLQEPELAITGTGLGNIHLFAVEHLDSRTRLFRGYGYKANSGFFYVLGDSGLIGLSMLIAVVVVSAGAARRLRRRVLAADGVDAAVASALLGLVLVVFLMRYDVLLFLMLGFVPGRLALIEDAGARGKMLAPGGYPFSLTS